MLLDVLPGFAAVELVQFQAKHITGQVFDVQALETFVEQRVDVLR